MTVIGIERRVDTSRDLLVFDPMFRDSPTVTDLIGQQVEVDSKGGKAGKGEKRYGKSSSKGGWGGKTTGDLLKAYRRDGKYLGRYGAFELLKLTPPESQMGDVEESGWEALSPKAPKVVTNKK